MATCGLQPGYFHGEKTHFCCLSARLRVHRPGPRWDRATWQGLWRYFSVTRDQLSDIGPVFIERNAIKSLMGNDRRPIWCVSSVVCFCPAWAKPWLKMAQRLISTCVHEKTGTIFQPQNWASFWHVKGSAASQRIFHLLLNDWKGIGRLEIKPLCKRRDIELAKHMKALKDKLQLERIFFVF